MIAAVRPLQRVKLLKLAEAGALVGVVTSVEEVIALLEVKVEDHEITARVRARMGALAVRSER